MGSIARLWPLLLCSQALLFQRSDGCASRMAAPKPPVISRTGEVAGKIKNATYLAAVYEHFSFSYVLPTKTVTREVAMVVMDTNMDVFLTQARKAAQQGAKIIVFPEYGITGLGLGRDRLLPFSEPVPHPADFDSPINPCEYKARFRSTVLGRLSCIAKAHSIVLVANMATVYPCSKSEDPNCPDDNRYQYNTNVAFLSDGSFVARYFKVNLFSGERNTFQFGRVAPRNLGVFETELGLFGMITCFDILFAQPASDLISKIGVRNIVFPTSWMNVLPLLTAIEFQQAFAMSRGVNLLASNQHFPLAKMTGSGLYAGASGAVAYHYDMLSYRGRLVIGRLPVVDNRHHATSWPTRNFTSEHQANSNRLGLSTSAWKKLRLSSSSESRDENNLSRPTHVGKMMEGKKVTSVNAHGRKTREGNSTFVATMNDDAYTFAPLAENAGKLGVCNNKLCCYLSYERKQVEPERDSQDLYALGAFDGLHVTDGQYYLQVCALVKCASASKGRCGAAVSQANTIFTSFHLTGNFSLNGEVALFPEVLTSGIASRIELAPTTEWKTVAPFDAIWSERGLSDPLLVAAIYGRRFDKDPTKGT